MALGSRRFGWGLLYGAGLLLLAWIVYQAGLDRIGQAFAAADWWLVLAASLLFGVNELINAQRWIYLLRIEHPSASARHILTSYLTNAFFSGLTPAKAGEALAPLLLKKRCGLPMSFSLAVILATRLADLAMLAILAPWVAWYLVRHVADPGSAPIGLVGAAGAVALGGLVFWWLLKRPRPDGSVDAQGTIPVWRRTMDNQWQRFRTDLGTLLKLRYLVGLMGLTAASWSILVIRVHCLINAFTPVPFIDNLVCQTVSLVAALVSMIPDGVGVTAASYAWLAAKMGHDWQAIVAAGVVGLVSTHLLRLLFALPGDLRDAAQLRAAGDQEPDPDSAVHR